MQANRRGAPLAYNKGVSDAQRYFIVKTDDLTGSLLEEPFGFWADRKSKS